MCGIEKIRTISKKLVENKMSLAVRLEWQCYWPFPVLCSDFEQ